MGWRSPTPPLLTLQIVRGTLNKNVIHTYKNIDFTKLLNRLLDEKFERFDGSKISLDAWPRFRRGL